MTAAEDVDHLLAMSRASLAPPPRGPNVGEFQFTGLKMMAALVAIDERPGASFVELAAELNSRLGTDYDYRYGWQVARTLERRGLAERVRRPDRIRIFCTPRGHRTAQAIRRAFG